MSQKRNLLPDIYKRKKRVCVGLAKTDPKSHNCPTPTTVTSTSSENQTISNTKAVLSFLRGLFPVDVFEDKLPALILKHQVYSVLNNRTFADKELNDLRLAGEIKWFRLPTGSTADEYCILFTDDYQELLRKISNEDIQHKKLIDKFQKRIASQYNDVSISRETLKDEMGFKEKDISILLRLGLFTLRDVGSWWLSIPNAGIFMKAFLTGRKAVLTTIRKSKYKEMLKSELEQRKWLKQAKLGLTFHIHDIIGAELVECIQTTSGQILRLSEK